MSSEKLDPAMLATLTDEERAAFEESEFSPEELAAMKGISGDDEDDGGDGDEETGDGDAVEAKTAEATEAADAADAVVETRATPAPRYEAKMPEDYAGQVAALKTQSDDLVKAFKAGEIDFDAYHEKSQALVLLRDDLVVARSKAEISGEMNEQSVEQTWANTIVQFSDKVIKEIDYRKDMAKQRDLDVFVKALAADDANADKPMDWYLVEAHKRVKALHGVAAVEDKPADDKKPVTARKPPLEGLPKTLAGVTGADGADDLAGEFTDLDGLDGFELETAIARMTPAMREKYAKAA